MSFLQYYTLYTLIERSACTLLLVRIVASSAAPPFTANAGTWVLALTYKVTFTLGTDEWVYILHFSLCAYSTCILYTGETYALVDWVGEESSSIVQSTKIGYMGVFTVGEVAKVRTSTGTFKAVIVASGKKLVHLVVVHLYTLNM